MRWCFLSPGFRSVQVLEGDSSGSGGAESQMAYLARDFAALGHDLTLIYGDGAASAPPRSLSGIRCVDAAPSWRRPASLAAFWRALADARPDVIWAHLPSDFLFIAGAFARTRPGTRFLYSLSSDAHCVPWNAYPYKRWLHGPLFALGLASAHVVTYQHRDQIGRVRRRLRRKLANVPNLAHTIATAPRDFVATDYDVVWVALIRPVKQLGRLLDLAEALPDRRFAIVGGFDALTLPPGAADGLRARMLGLPNVTWLGPRRSEEVIDAVARSRVLVNTSSHEGFPITMLEAWSMGVPVVSLTVDPGGLVSAERLGAVAGTPERLVALVRDLTASRDLNEAAGRRGLAYVRSHHGISAVRASLARIWPDFAPPHGSEAGTGACAGTMTPDRQHC